MELFYLPGDPEETIELPEDESRHLVKVLRFKSGDEIFIVNGQGMLYKCILENTTDGKCRLNILERTPQYGKRSCRLHIGIAPTKNTDRLEWFLEKATEIGIEEITPVICRRSERKEIKEDRLNKILIAAMKQSVKAYLPKLNPASPLIDLLKIPLHGQGFMCTMGSQESILSVCRPGQDALVLIGPEGDFHPDEIEQALRSGYKLTSLGQSRLRTETAGLVACSAFAFLNP